jgi:membrane protease YdiL (CAAX protease family)
MVQEIQTRSDHRIDTTVAVLVSLAVVAWGNGLVLLQRRIGGDLGEILTTVAHPFLGSLGAAIMLNSGWSRTDLGLAFPPRRAIGARWGVALAGLAFGWVAIGVLRKGIGTESTSRRIFVVRLAVGTALGEELIHRGVLLALWARTRLSPGVVIVANALVFSAWHVVGSLRKGPRAVGEVPITGLGALLFLAARSRSRSLIGACSAHLSTNILGLALKR